MSGSACHRPAMARAVRCTRDGLQLPILGTGVAVASCVRACVRAAQPEPGYTRGIRFSSATNPLASCRARLQQGQNESRPRLWRCWQIRDKQRGARPIGHGHTHGVQWCREFSPVVRSRKRGPSGLS